MNSNLNSKFQIFVKKQVRVAQLFSARISKLFSQTEEFDTCLQHGARLLVFMGPCLRSRLTSAKCNLLIPLATCLAKGWGPFKDP